MLLSIESGMKFVMETVMKPIESTRGFDKYWCIYSPELGRHNSSGIVGYGKTTVEAIHDLAYALKKKNLDTAPKPNKPVIF